MRIWIWHPVCFTFCSNYFTSDVRLAAKDESVRIGLGEAEVAAAIAFREKTLKERAQETSSRVLPSSVKARDTLRQEQALDEADDEADDEHEVDERTPFLKARKQSGRAVPVDDGKPRALSIDPLATSSAFDETMRDRIREDVKRKRAQLGVVEDDDEDEDEEQIGPSARATRDVERLLERNFTAPVGKKIAVPVRIEPKVYFATERTFLVSNSICTALPGSARILTRFHRRNGYILRFISELSPPHS